MANFCGICGQRVEKKTGLCPQCDQAILMKKKNRKKSVRAVIAVLCCISIIAVGIFGALRFFNKNTVSYSYGEYNSLMEGFTDVLVTDEKSAIEAVGSVSACLGIDNATEELKVSNVQTVKDDRFYRIQQYYNEIPVYGRSIVVSADKNGYALSLTSNYKQTSKDIDLEPKASQTEIAKSITEYFNIDNVSIQNVSEDNLVIYNLNGEDVLAYYLTINGLGKVIVNADSAEVIHYSQILNDITAEVKSKDGKVTSIGWQNDDGSYHLYNDEHKIAVFDVKGINTVIDDKGSVHTNFKEYGIDTLYSKNNKFDKDAIILLNDVIDISNYYKNLGYGGFEQVHIAINDSYDDGKNARGGGGEFDGIDSAILLMGKDFDFANKDVVAHEYTHAVSGMLVGWSRDFMENSALNEAYSDIFGSLYENNQNPDWKMVHLSEVIRDLTDPSKTNSFDSVSDIDTSDDYNIYTLSTIVSHSAYLMWNGIDGSDNRKIDTATLSEIWYRSMLLLQSNADFSQCRNAVELSARTMLKNETITEEQYRTVVTAFERVGIENATFTYTETVKNQFDLSVLSSEETENVHFKLEVINNEMPKLVIEKTAITGRQSLDLKDGTYVLRITDVSDERNISKSINIKVVVDGDSSNAKDEVVVNTDFTDVIVVILNEKPSDNKEDQNTDTSNAILSPKSAVDIYMANKNVWMENPGYMPMQGYGYCLLDLDFDGVLELINSVNDGSGRYTYNKFYKLNLEKLSVEEFQPEDSQDYDGVDYYYMSHRSKLMKNQTDGMLFYVFENYGRVSTEEGVSAYSESYMKNGKLYENYLFSEYWHPDYDNNTDKEIREYTFRGEDVSKSEYEQKTNAFYNENKDMNLVWKCISGSEFDKGTDSTQKQLLLDAYRSYSYDGFSFDEIETYDITPKDSEPPQLNTEKAKQYSIVDYYANTDKWAGEYGFSDLAQFTYYSNNILQSVSEEHLGVISAFEYDCDNDSHNELITLSLLPTNDGKLYLSPAMFTNKNNIEKTNALKYTMNKLKSDVPVLEIGSIGDVWDGYVTVRAFVDGNKLCVLYGMYSSAKIGRGEMYDNIYVYEISATGLNLYRHYYCYEEEVTADIRSCSVGETVTNKTHVLNMNYDIGTPNWLSLNEQEKEQWKSMVKQAVSEMRSDASGFGFDNYLASESDLKEEGSNYITSSKIYGDEDFLADDLILDALFYCESGTGSYLAEELTDYTNIRTKINVEKQNLF